MAIRNNTTSLGMGGSPGAGGGITARQFNDYTARSISTEVARANYRKSVRSEYKVAELRQYVFKMISSWSEADKQAILAEYGDTRMLKSGKLNEAVTETLIIRLKEEDLQILLKDIKRDEVKLGKTVQRIRSGQKRMASKFGAGSFEDIYSAVSKAKNPKNIQKALKAYDRSFKLPREVKGAFGPLKKELRVLIPALYDRVEMTGLATKMGINFSEGVTEKELINMIINKTLLYVAIITGKTKAIYAGAILDPEPFKGLLTLTSMPFLGGSSGLSSSGVKSLRDEMLASKALMKTKLNQRNTNIIGKRGIERLSINPLKLPGSLLQLAGGTVGGILGGAGGFLSGKGSKGISEGFKQGFDIAGIPGEFLRGPMSFKKRRMEKEAIKNVDATIKATGIPDEFYIVDSQNNKILKSTSDLIKMGAEVGLKPRKLKNDKDKERYIKEIMQKQELPKIRQKQLEEKQKKLERKGKGLSIQEQAELDSLRPKDGQSLFPKNKGKDIPYVVYAGVPADITNWNNIAVPVYVVNGIVSNNNNKNTSSSITATSGSPVTPSGLDPDLEDSALDTYKMTGRGFKKTTVVFPGAGGSDPFVALVDKPGQAMNIKGAMALRVFDQSNIILAQEMEKKAKKKSAGVQAQATVISGQAQSMGIKMIKKEAASPVYIVNKNPIPTDAGAILKAALKTLFSVLIPFAGGKIADTILGAVTGAGGIDQLLSIAGLATGGRGKALPRYAEGVKKSSVSSFIAGDSLNGKPNEEQVSIDWNKKEFMVKPIPAMSSQDLNKTGISQATRMSSAERNEPMKVYAVNPGITDMIDIGSAKVSMIGLVADMAGRLASIEGLLAIGNQQGVAIATATAATASNVGRLASKSSNNVNPFAGGFPSDLDNILVGR
jgi:hypothetical protein